MADDDVHEIKGKLDQLLMRMEMLERLISIILGSQELTRAIGLLRMSGELYSDYSNLAERIALAQRHLNRGEMASDETMKCILRILVAQGPRNISEITKTVRSIRGKASRSRIAKKLLTMEQLGVIQSERTTKQKKYEIKVTE